MSTTTTNYNLVKPAAEDFYNVADQNGNMDIIDTELKNVNDKINTDLSAHVAAADPHSQYATNDDLNTHKTAPVMDHPNNSVTDLKIGNRTLDPALAGGNNTGTMTQLLSWLGKMIKSITGKTNWYDVPSTSLEALNTNAILKNGSVAMTGGLKLIDANSTLERFAGGQVQLKTTNGTALLCGTSISLGSNCTFDGTNFNRIDIAQPAYRFAIGSGGFLCYKASAGANPITVWDLINADAFVSANATQSLANKTLTTPKIVNAGSITDENGNEQIKFVTTPNAVNELTVKNAATGNAVEIQASGGDANIDIDVIPKGTGVLKSKGINVATATNTLNLTNKTLVSPVIKFGNSEGITDDSGNEYLKFAKTANAVNELTIMNNSAGSAPELQVTGTDESIGMNLVTKGFGKVTVNAQVILTGIVIAEGSVEVAHDSYVSVNLRPGGQHNFYIPHVFVNNNTVTYGVIGANAPAYGLECNLAFGYDSSIKDQIWFTNTSGSTKTFDYKVLYISM